MASPTIDTPDYQRGVISAQKLLATVAAGNQTVTTGIPPNAESIVVCVPALTAPTWATCQGTTTGAYYAGSFTVPITGSGGTGVNFFFDASSALDEEVEITIGAFTTEWYVYADAGVHVVTDVSKYTDANGIQYVISSAPDTVNGSHPPVELEVEATGGLASGATLLPAAGIGKRYRIFYATAGASTAATAVELRDSVSTNNFLAGVSAAAGNQLTMDFKPSGLPLSADAAVTVTTGAGTAVASVVYTTENI